MAAFHTYGDAGGRAVLVIHSWWGKTAGVEHFGRRLADQGFLVGLADLFDGDTATSIPEAHALRARRRSRPMYRILIADVEQLCARAGSTVGVVGFSMGGHWAVWLAQRPDLPLDATVLYYATRAGSFTHCRSPILAHFAEDDPWVKPAGRRRMEQAIADGGVPYEAHDYPATQHWFAESDRPEYHRTAADEAFERTVAHLRR